MITCRESNQQHLNCLLFACRGRFDQSRLLFLLVLPGTFRCIVKGTEPVVLNNWDLQVPPKFHILTAVQFIAWVMT